MDSFRRLTVLYVYMHSLYAHIHSLSSLRDAVDDKESARPCQTVDDDIDNLYALLEEAHSDGSDSRPDLTFA